VNAHAAFWAKARTYYRWLCADR